MELGGIVLEVGHLVCCWNFVSQTPQSHLNLLYVIPMPWRCAFHIFIIRPGQRVVPFFVILIYKITLISCDKVWIGCILIAISDNFSLVLIKVNLFDIVHFCLLLFTPLWYFLCDLFPSSVLLCWSRAQRIPAVATWTWTKDRRNLLPDPPRTLRQTAVSGSRPQRKDLHTVF